MHAAAAYSCQYMQHMAHLLLLLEWQCRELDLLLGRQVEAPARRRQLHVLPLLRRLLLLLLTIISPPC